MLLITRQGCSLSPLLFSTVLEVLATAIYETKKEEAPKLEKKEVKLSLFAGDIILHIENCKYSTKKLLELIYNFSKVAIYRLYVQDAVVFLYTNSEQSEEEIKKTIPFTTASKRIPRMNLNKKMMDWKIKDTKETKQDTNKCSWIRSNKGKMSIPKMTYRINVISKILTAFVLDLDQKKIHIEPQRFWIAKEMLRKNKVEGSMLPNIKLQYKARVIKEYGIGI